jgi:alpha-1,3-rhamnosyl/mannosyltransferase
MRVLIDATAVLLRSAGIKSYIWHWIRHLRAQSMPGEIRAFPLLDDMGALWHEGSTMPLWATYPRLGLLYGVNHTRLLDLVVGNADIFHASNQVRRRPRKTLLTATVHDLTCWLMPELHTPANVRADRGFADTVLKTANGLIAVSENTRQDAIRVLGVHPEKIQTIYSGVSDDYFTARPKPAARPYVLSVGTIEPRKNLDTLLDAWQQIKNQDCDLVIAGASGWSSEKTVARLRSRVPRVRYLGYVPEAELPGLTAGATAFVYPSLYEGFGFPVAQAMAAGVPVITSNTSCLPEISGEGAVFVDPCSPAEIASAIDRVLESTVLRSRLSEAGKSRAERYRWDICASQSLEFFKRIA